MCLYIYVDIHLCAWHDVYIESNGGKENEHHKRSNGCDSTVCTSQWSQLEVCSARVLDDGRLRNLPLQRRVAADSQHQGTDLASQLQAAKVHRGCALMATKLQRALLWHMKENDEKAIIATGHKSSQWGILEGGAAFIQCSECVLWGLVRSGFVSKLTDKRSSAHEDHTYKLTILGFNTAGLQKPQIRPRFTGGSHGPRWV